MSTLTYAMLTTRRLQSAPGMSFKESPPGVKTYVDMVAALVPAEVLTAHAVMLAATTEVKDGVTTITDRDVLYTAFWILVALAVALYVVPRLFARDKWEKWDVLRVVIPPAAFVVWTALQRTTAFDVVRPGMSGGARTVYAVAAAIVLALLAAGLAKMADQKQPSAV